MDFAHTVAVDTETCLIDRGEDLAPRIACMTYCSNEDWTPGIAIGPDIARVFRAIAANDSITVTGANFAFDAHVLLRAFPELTGSMLSMYDDDRIVDVQLNQRLIDIARGQLDTVYDPRTQKRVPKYYSLAALYDEYGFGLLDKSADTWRLRYGELIGLPQSDWPEDAIRYALDDAKATLHVHTAEQQHAHLLADGPAQARAAFALQRVAIRGLVTDGDAVERYIEELKQLVDDSRATLMAAEFVRKSGSRDTKKVKAYMQQLCTAADVEPKRTATGEVSLDAEACRDFDFDPLIHAYHVFSTSDTLLTRAEALLEGSRGLPLQTQFVTLLENGRTSSRIPKPPLVGVQTQNLPRAGKLRECFVPRPGYYYLSIDFNSDEIACFAQSELILTGKSELAKALRDGLDVHCVLAAEMLGESYDVVHAQRKHGRYRDARQLAKIGNFGLLGGMGAKSLMRHANLRAASPEDRISLAQATRLRDAWFRRWQTQPYFDAINSALGHDPFTGVCTIRQFVSGRIRGALSYTEAANTLFSGLAGDGNKDALYACVRASLLARPGDAFHDTHVVNFLHDELFFEVPINTATRASKALCALMIDTKRRWLPDVPTTAEPALMRRWFKAAEPVWSPEGELLPWDPEMTRVSLVAA